MTELLVDREDGRLLARRDTMDMLAGIVPATREQRGELERAGWLVDDRPPDDLEALVMTWASGVATIAVRLRRDGRTVAISGVADGSLAVLLVPVEPGSDLHHVLASPVESLPRWVASAAGLGPRPHHGEDADLVPLSWAAVELCLGRPEELAMRHDARAHATRMAPEESVDAVLTPGAQRVTLTVTMLDGGGEEVVDVLDAGDRGLWLIAGIPPDRASAAAIPFSMRGVWQLLGRALDAPARRAADALTADATPR